MPTPAAIALARPLVERFEGLQLSAYRCPAGRLTIGYGHTGPDVTPGLSITADRADELLRADLEAALAQVRAAVGVQMPHREAALASFVFNLGAGAFRAGSLPALVRAGRYAETAAKLAEYDKARDPRTRELVRLPGLTRRRSAERALFEGRA